MRIQEGPIKRAMNELLGLELPPDPFPRYVVIGVTTRFEGRPTITYISSTTTDYARECGYSPYFVIDLKEGTFKRYRKEDWVEF